MKIARILIVCGLISVAVLHAQSTHASDDNCFPHKALYTTEPVDIRSNDSYIADWLGKTTKNKTYTVLKSKKAALFGSCWIKISSGWLLRRANASAIKPAKPEQQTTNTSSTRVEKCYMSSKVYVTGTMNIRSGPTVSNRKVGTAQAGQSFSVSRSQRSDDYCWLKISKGWIAKTARVRMTASAMDTVSTSSTAPVTGASGGRCYPSSTAYITGSVNVREQATANSKVVQSVRAGQALRVQSSAQGDTYCWVKTLHGWIAKTGRVSSTKPPVYTPSTTNRAGLPQITGDAPFVSKVIAAYNYLRDRAPTWFNYAVSKTRTVVITYDSASFAYVNRKHVEVSHEHTDPLILLASVLVHEACHMHQWDAGRYKRLDPKTREVECLDMQLDLILQLEPGSSVVSKLRRAIKNPVIWSFE